MENIVIEEVPRSVDGSGALLCDSFYYYVVVFPVVILLRDLLCAHY